MTEGNVSLKQRLVDSASVCLTAYQFADDYGIVELVTHPFNYADTLIRIGYEPFPPLERRSLLSMYTPHLFLPGVLPYAQYLNIADGFPGVFRCVLPCLARKYVSTGIYRFAQSQCPAQEEPPEDANLLSYRFTVENLSYYLKAQGWSLVCKMVATVASHPFHVVAVRCMGQLVGREESCKFPHLCIAEIYRSEGLGGFLSGLIPRLIGDIVYASTAAVIYISFMHSLQNISWRIRPDIVSRLEKLVPILANSLAAPYGNQFYNVSDIMIVNGASLSIGHAPFMPVYSSWYDCWSQLRRDKLFKTSSGIFSRLYTGPYMSPLTTGGTMKPFGDNFGPTYFPKAGQQIPYLLKDYYAPLLPLNSSSVKSGIETFKNNVLSNEVIMSALQGINSL